MRSTSSRPRRSSSTRPRWAGAAVAGALAGASRPGDDRQRRSSARHGRRDRGADRCRRLAIVAARGRDDERTLRCATSPTSSRSTGLVAPRGSSEHLARRSASTFPDCATTSTPGTISSACATALARTHARYLETAWRAREGRRPHRRRRRRALPARHRRRDRSCRRSPRSSTSATTSRSSGLHVSPDLDSVLYALAGARRRGARLGRRRRDVERARDASRRSAARSWFRLGDRDLGLHLVRTQALRAGDAALGRDCAACRSARRRARRSFPPRTTSSAHVARHAERQLRLPGVVRRARTSRPGRPRRASRARPTRDLRPACSRRSMTQT